MNASIVILCEVMIIAIVGYIYFTIQDRKKGKAKQSNN